MTLVRQKRCSDVKCFHPECTKPISVVDLKQLLEKEEFEEYNTNALTELITTDHNLVKCSNPQCNTVIERMEIADPKQRK